MTEQELKDVFQEPDLIAHENMKDVAFYPIGIEILKDVYKVNGLWYCYTIDGFLSGNGVDPAREIISIKKEDLAKWKTIKKKD